jgi:hypothetical protein
LRFVTPCSVSKDIATIICTSCHPEDEGGEALRNTPQRHNPEDLDLNFTNVKSSNPVKPNYASSLTPSENLN